jgi:CBS domain containing-hemolysin-like protein
MKLVYALLALGFIKCVIFYKVYHSIPAVELKRRAKRGDKQANKLYKVAAYGPSLEVLLWAVGTTCAAVLIIWSARTVWPLAATVVVLMAWLVVWGRFFADGWAGKLAAAVAGPFTWILSVLQPVLRPISGLLPPGRPAYTHTRIYEKKDWLEVLSKQVKQSDNRIDQADLNIAANAMTFGDKLVSSIMVPKDQVKMVKAGDTIGPLLMDELHQSGFSRFPVINDSGKSDKPQVVGTLYLNNLIGYEGNGKVKDLSRHEVYYINEDANLRQALNAFLKTHHHLLIVINSFEEMVGVLSLEDVLEQILGKQIAGEFDNFENLRSVAAMDAKEEPVANETEESKPEQTAESVVE